MSTSPSRSSSRSASNTPSSVSGSSRTRNMPSPSGPSSSASGSVPRGARASVKGPRTVRSPVPNEQKGSPNNDSIQEMRELVKTQELELTRLRGLVEDSDAAALESSREAQSLKQDLEDAQHERHKLEDQLELLQQEIERMRDQVRELQRAKQESENLAESEQQRLLEENRVIIRSNSELSAQLKSLRSSLQEKARETSPSIETEVETDPSQSPSSSRIVKQKERQIEGLRLELADLEVRLAEQTNLATAKSRQVEEALLQAKLENIRLTENVESYQMLLQERTLKGEYPMLRVDGQGDESDSSRPVTPSYSEHGSNATSLATELEEAETQVNSLKTKALQAEIRHLKDSNKAMSLYINEIIGRLLQTQGFEHVLEKDVNKALPAPPPPRAPPTPKMFNPSRLSVDGLPRKTIASENPAHKRMFSEAPSTSSPGIGGGLSRAFSFRKKPDPSASANLRPLKLVEEQHPQPQPRVDNTAAKPRIRYQTEDTEVDSMESKAAKRASWVPGWFAKGGITPEEEK